MAIVKTLLTRLGVKSSVFNRKMKRAGNTVKRFAKRVAFAGAAMAAIGVAKGLRGAIAFEKQMAEVSTMLSGNVGPQVAKFAADIKALSMEFGQTKETLSKGLYDILSAGIAAADGLDVLTVATKAAIGGATDTATAVDGLTTVINAYGLDAKQATRVSDLMFQVVRDGKVTYAELAENIGKLAPLAKTAGLSLDDMMAAIATVVKVEKPERAMTAIAAAMAKAAQMGTNLLTLVNRFRGKSLMDIMGAGISKRAAVGVALLSGNIKTLHKEMANMRGSAGAAGEAFDKMAGTTDQAINKARESVNVLLKGIGEKLMPKVKEVADAFNQWVSSGDALKDMMSVIEGIADAAWLVYKAFEAMKLLFTELPSAMQDIAEADTVADMAKAFDIDAYKKMNKEQRDAFNKENRERIDGMASRASRMAARGDLFAKFRDQLIAGREGKNKPKRQDFQPKITITSSQFTNTKAERDAQSAGGKLMGGISDIGSLFGNMGKKIGTEIKDSIGRTAHVAQMRMWLGQEEQQATGAAGFGQVIGRGVDIGALAMATHKSPEVKATEKVEKEAAKTATATQGLLALWQGGG